MCSVGWTPTGMFMSPRWWIRSVGCWIPHHSVPTPPAMNSWATGWGHTAVLPGSELEGTGSYGAGLARHLISIGVEVVEVNRPNRQLRRRWGKTDATDAQAAARAALNGQATGLPKSGDGPVEGIRMLSVARRSAVKARTQAINQIHALVVTAPDQFKHQLSGLSPKARVKVCAAYRPGTADTTTRYAKAALRSLARRYQTLTAEIGELDTEIRRLCAKANPALLATPGVGPDIAAALLITAGDNPQRMATKSVLRSSLRCEPCPSLLGTYRPSPPQPRREPPSQPGPVADRHHPRRQGPAHHYLCEETPGGRQNPSRDHPLSQTVHRPRDLPPVDQPTPNTLRRRPPLPPPKHQNDPRSGPSLAGQGVWWEVIGVLTWGFVL